MGTFRIEIQGVGGHGCQREKKDGERTQGCGQPNCPDCLARALVTRLQTVGVSFALHSEDPNQNQYARLTHWPGQECAVVDDLLSGVRHGSF